MQTLDWSQHDYSTEAAIAKIQRQLIESNLREECEQSFARFAQEAWKVVEPGRDLIWKWHHDAICEHLQAFYFGDIQRLVINTPPGTTKSLLFSVFGPCWLWTRMPHRRLLNLSHDEDLAVRDALKSRNLMKSEWYQALWGHRFEFSGDQNLKSRYSNDKTGHRIAQGITAGVTGEGGDYVQIDDPHDAKKAQFSDAIRQQAIDAYDMGLTSRLRDRINGGFGIIMQRLHHKDLAGHVMSKEHGRYVTLVIPMRYEGKTQVSSWSGATVTDPRTDVARAAGTQDEDDEGCTGELLIPELYPEEDCLEMEEDMGRVGAAGQFQQRPSPEEGAILLKKDWRMWPSNKPMPMFLYLLQSYDTAFTEDDLKENAYSARTTWGVFRNEQTGMANVMLMEAWRDRVGMPDLRRKARTDYREWQPDTVLIEEKASGISLRQELRRSNVPVRPYNPDRSKVARAYACSPYLEAGLVWYPDRKWANGPIEECSAFPNGEFADWVDTCTQAWLFIFKSRLVEMPDVAGNSRFNTSSKSHRRVGYANSRNG